MLGVGSCGCGNAAEGVVVGTLRFFYKLLTIGLQAIHKLLTI